MEKKLPKILVIGALGQIGRELTLALRKRFGRDRVIASDLSEDIAVDEDKPLYVRLNALDKSALENLLVREGITQIYHLAAILSARAEKGPVEAWNLNMQSLLNVLDLSVALGIEQVFWPSSIAVFGPDAPRENCPQLTPLNPATVYGISKAAGELWCKYYFEKFGLDVRSLRYPGLISFTGAPGGGTTDYAVDIFHHAVKEGSYTCFLEPGSRLPMMYMQDAIRATIELMEAPKASVSIRTAYNVAGMSFSPSELYDQILLHVPGFDIFFEPDFRQQIADSWPDSIDDENARSDWNWKPAFRLENMVEAMLMNLAGRVQEK